MESEHTTVNRPTSVAKIAAVSAALSPPPRDHWPQRNCSAKMRDMSLDLDSPDLNPYASPQSTDAPPIPDSPQQTEAERIRREFLSREASIKSIGTLCYLGSILLSFYSVVFLTVSVNGFGSIVAALTAVVVCAGLAVLHGWIGHGLRNFRHVVRPWAIVISVLWMFYPGIGTVLGILAVIWLSGKKARYVLSEEYREIVEATPHIRYKTSRVTWIVLGILIAVIVLAVVVPILSLFLHQ